MTQQEIIQRIYGEYYEHNHTMIDEWGRMNVENVRTKYDDQSKEFEIFCRDLRIRKFVWEGITYLQPEALSNLAPEPTPQMTKQDLEFIDQIAIQTMLFYLHLQQPASFKDSLKASRVAYRQALAMWDVKTNGLQGLADEEGIKVIV
jgi:hypothetical protein